ncbi:hypothetical protein NKH75_30830 [Mesorhizobium sp. M0984]|uniref:hypothetical protein n=1 Tax=Mesorhizobium sp. M0984 TaxID=2957041 RepID=UPI00333B0792
MKDLDRSANQSKKNYRTRLAFRPNQTSNKHQHRESNTVIELVKAESNIDSEFLESGTGRSASTRTASSASTKTIFN